MPHPMTTKEAEKKWCPFARTFDGAGVTGNRYISMDNVLHLEGAYCIHEKCMAWVSPANESKGFCALITIRG